MEDNLTRLNKKIVLLKESRLQFLRLHKLLVDVEREKFERMHGQISSGQFLNLLLNEIDFQWLRKFSVLIVEIDEMFDLDDGFTQEMIDKHLGQMREILDLQTPDEQFIEKYTNYLQSDAQIAGKHGELKKLLSED